MKNDSLQIAMTGATGFVGKNFRKLLNVKKIPFISIAKRNFRNYKLETKIISKIISDKLAVKVQNCNALVHLIGIGRETPQNSFHDVNVKITKEIVRLCKKTNIKKIIYISGLGASKNSTTSYFISKYKAERDIIESGLDYTIFRPSYIVGRNDLLSKNLKRQIKNGTIMIPGSGNYKLQPIFVGDVSKIILQALASKKFSKKIIDLVGPKTVSFEDYINDFVNSKKIKIQQIDLEKAYFEALHNPKSIYGVDDLNMMVGSFVGDFNTLKKLSGIKFHSYKDVLQSSSLP